MPDQSFDCAIRSPASDSRLNVLKCKLQLHLKNGDENLRCLFDEIVHVAEEIAADRCLLTDEVRLLKQQNDEKRARQAVQSTVVGEGKAWILSWDDARERQLEKSGAAYSCSRVAATEEGKVTGRPDRRGQA